MLTLQGNYEVWSKNTLQMIYSFKFEDFGKFKGFVPASSVYHWTWDWSGFQSIDNSTRQSNKVPMIKKASKEDRENDLILLEMKDDPKSQISG